MSELVEISGQQYRIGRLDAKRQFHVARRLAPLLAGLGGALKGEAKGFAEMVSPIAEALAKMSDEDTDYVLDTCLLVVQRQSGQGWQSVMVKNGGLLFQDIDLPAMLQLTVAVIQQNLGSFFPAGPSPASTAAA
ncbi:phage tail assembly chaperone [Caballeronia telluris]|uniref:Bacteriophage protein n=1 Tax=Caballeronia telluris TaxID=326475 RepID=A0A158G1F6_9BURK|nr:hypothetical protein [Caballeronia telluris]SAL25717.1 putative bacteriophage protein [Caballeronia telluris]